MDNFCLCGALVLHLHRTERLEKEATNLFNLLLEIIDENEPANFRGVCIEDIVAVEDIVQADHFLCIEIVEGSMIVELARRIWGKYSNTVRLLQYFSQLCYACIKNALFKA